MSVSLKVASTYKVRYEGSCLAQCRGDVNDLITEMCPGTYVSDDEYTLEVPNGEFEGMLGRLDAMGDREFNNRFPLLRRQRVADALHHLLDLSDKENDFVRLEWF